ncbi:MAG: hypothetical protein JNL40_03380 [Cyclobacteriaceae bacterium]|nr:hypothetical protein [Cyclobacteriaceae bacterium]
MRSNLASVLFCLGVLVHLSSCTSTSVEPGANGGDLVVSENRTIATSMTVGNLTVKGSAILTIDYTSTPENVFVVVGNVLIQDAAQLIVKGNQSLMNDGFIIANEFSSQYTITTKGTSVIRLENIGLRTQAGTVTEKGNIYMSHVAMDRSAMIIDGAQLDHESSWLLGNFKNKSTLTITNSVHIPTEIYLNDSCSVSITGTDTKTGLWLSLTSGANTMQLPDVSSGAWSWNTGAAIGPGVHWSLSVVNSNPGLGVQLFPAATAEITGHGVAPKELTIGYFVSASNEVLDNLHVGLQNGVIIPGRLTLNNVHLGPIAWQVYSVTSASLTINNSTINEIGIIGNGSVTVNNSLLQLAVLASYGQNSSLTVNSSEVWNQSIETNSNAQITLNNCTIYGSQFITRSAQSKISIIGGSFLNNPPIDRSKPPIDMITGYPNYNPFCAPGPPKKSGAGVISCTGVANCNW